MVTAALKMRRSVIKSGLWDQKHPTAPHVRKRQPIQKDALRVRRTVARNAVESKVACKIFHGVEEIQGPEWGGCREWQNLSDLIRLPTPLEGQVCKRHELGVRVRLIHGGPQDAAIGKQGVLQKIRFL